MASRAWKRSRRTICGARSTLLKHAGNRAKVAAVLGISERNIYRLIKQHGLGD